MLLIAVAALHHPVLNPPEAARLAFFLLFSCVYQRLHHLFWNIFFPAEAETAVVIFFLVLSDTLTLVEPICPVLIKNNEPPK